MIIAIRKLTKVIQDEINDLLDHINIKSRHLKVLNEVLIFSLLFLRILKNLINLLIQIAQNLT